MIQWRNRFLECKFAPKQPKGTPALEIEEDDEM